MNVAAIDWNVVETHVTAYVLGAVALGTLTLIWGSLAKPYLTKERILAAAKHPKTIRWVHDISNLIFILGLFPIIRIFHPHPYLRTIASSLLAVAVILRLELMFQAHMWYTILSTIHISESNVTPEDEQYIRSRQKRNYMYFLWLLCSTVAGMQLGLIWFQ